ncbi:hypothetical protein [Shewanella fidelis]|uniref:Uncharacterized protein n=1 Tax=Shewanella fidelis TaxID=173509 RepID=A0AAW8NJS9_9GAMM|nr:hypothetical protein [Shewanella fidelis]MDR8523468.1 hypothetical protein [Shewanella fidelis]MDW4813299.1 hypothetical protein [Shewanella fidelis]
MQSNNHPYNAIDEKGYLWKHQRVSSGETNIAINSYDAEPNWLLHRLIFITIYLYAKNNPIPRDKLLKGIGSPYLSRVSGILGDWEDKGFLIKSTHNRRLYFSFDEHVYDFSWQSPDAKRTDAFRHKLNCINFNKNGAFAARVRAKVINIK